MSAGARVLVLEGWVVDRRRQVYFYCNAQSKLWYAWPRFATLWTVDDDAFGF
jgi:hypothetical protein